MCFADGRAIVFIDLRRVRHDSEAKRFSCVASRGWSVLQVSNVHSILAVARIALA